MTYTHSPEEELAVDHFLMLHDPDAPPEALEAALIWIDAAPENRVLYDRINRFWSAVDAAPEERPQAPADRTWARMVLRAAACLLPFFIAAVMLFGLPSGPHAPSPLPTQSYSTQVGEIRHIRLPDGTTMTLGAGSRATLKFSTWRQVYLARGRAYFEVARDPSRPFIVQTPRGNVTALGTGFDVNLAKSGEHVTLAHGVVEVTAHLLNSRGTRTVRLSPGQEIKLLPQGDLSPVRNVDLNRVLAWRDGEFYFVGQHLGEVAAELSPYTKIKIVFADFEAANVAITGVVRIGRIVDWLRGVAAATDLEMVEAPDQITLRTRERRPRPSDFAVRVTPQ